MGATTTGRIGEEEYAGLVRLLNIHRRLRTPEDVFEIANSLYRASFVRQLDVVTRSGIARYAEAFEIIPGKHVPLSEDGDNDLFIILSGSVKAEAAGLEFLPGDTFGFRAPTSPSFQLMTETPVVTCATGGLAAKVPFEYCVEFWPDMDQSDSDDSESEQSESNKDPGQDLVWSPELARSILLRGGAEGDEALVALEYLNFPPINGHSTEVREILVSEFKMRRDVKGSVFLEWTNQMPVNPNDIQLSRLDCDQVIMVVSGCLKATCRRNNGGRKSGEGRNSTTSIGNREGIHRTDSNDRPVEETINDAGDLCSRNNNNNNNNKSNNDRGDDRSDPRYKDGEFTLMHLQAGDVFPPQSGLMMMGSRLRKDKSDFDQEVEEEWEDFDTCALIGDTSASTTEILLVDAHVFHDVVYPGIDLFYSMEPVRSILSKGPGLRTWREINYIARNVLSHHVAFQQMSSSSLERIASRLTDRMVVHGGEVLVEHGQSVTDFLLLLRGSARIMEISKTMKTRSTARRAKVGRLEPGDLWGMQHTHEGAEARFEIVAVEGCELIRGDIELVRAAEKQACIHVPVGARAMRSLAVLPENRTRRDVRNIVDELSTPKSGLDVARFRRIPVCLKNRIAAALRLEVWPALYELKRDDKKDPNTYFFIIKGSISLQAITKANRFTMETLDMPATGQLKSLDVDNGLALEDWRASGLGPCVATHFDRQVVGEYPHSDENLLRVRAVTRQETTAAVIDGDVYAEHLVNDGMNYSDSHSEVCREVLAQLKKYPRDYPGVGGLESDILCRLLKENPVLKHISTSCLPRLTGSIALKRYDAGEVVTEAEDYGDNIFIILEGFLEYAVQESHRGVIDRSLAKEVGIAPGLRCVGVMTAGDFFSPESMLGKRKGRRPRVMNHGSYRIRCSPDLIEGGTGDGGAICLILPREKVEIAVHRDRQVQRSRLLQTGAVPAAMSKGELQVISGQPTAVTPAQTTCLSKVDFGGPGGSGGLEGQETNPHGNMNSSNAICEEWRIDQHNQEEYEGGNRTTKPNARGVVFANDAVGERAERTELPNQSRAQMTALAAVPKTEEMAAGGDDLQRHGQRQHSQQQKQAFLTGVPPPNVKLDGPEVPPGTPMSNISTTIAKLQGLENSPSRAPASARNGRGWDVDDSARQSITGLPKSTEESTNAPATRMSQPRDGTAQRSANGSVDLSRRQEQSDDLSGAAGAPAWADGSDRSGASFQYAGGSAWCEDFHSGHMGASSCSSIAAAASDQWKSGTSSVFVRGELGVDGNMERIEARRVDDIALFAPGTTAITAIGTTAKNLKDKNDENDDSSLLDFLRSFVSSHVDPFKLEPHANEVRGATWVTPRQDASARLLADEQALLGRLSGDVYTASTGEGDKQLTRGDPGARVLQMTPLWCRQMLPQTTSGRTTARDDTYNRSGGGGVVGLGQTPPEATSRAKEATSGWEGEALFTSDGNRPFDHRHDHHRCSERATWRLTENGTHGGSAGRGGDSVCPDSTRHSEQHIPQRRRRGGAHPRMNCHVPVGPKQQSQFASELEPRRRHREPCSPISGCRRGRRNTKHRSVKPQGGDNVASAVAPVQPPRWSRPSIRSSPRKKASSMQGSETPCPDRNELSRGAKNEETGDETHSSEGSNGRRDRQERDFRQLKRALSDERDKSHSPDSKSGEKEGFSEVDTTGPKADPTERPKRSSSSSSSSSNSTSGRRRSTGHPSCSSGSDGNSSRSSRSSGSRRKRNATTAASFRWQQETHVGETRQQTQPQQLLVGYFYDKYDDVASFAATGVLAARGTNSARRAAGKSARAATVKKSSKSRGAVSPDPESCGSVTGGGMIYDTLDQSSVFVDEEQRRPCTGAPSHGWRNPLLSRGGRGAMPANDVDVTDQCSPRKLASRVDPTMLSQLPADSETLAHCSRRLRSRCELPDVANYSRGVANRSAAMVSRKRSGGVKCRKQPPVVRRLKITLQELTDPHSGA